MTMRADKKRSRLNVESLEVRDVPSGVTGPSSSATPYIVSPNPSVEFTSIMTVGDSVNNKPDGTTPYRAVGIMDGLGPYDNGDGTFTLVMNHEIAVNVTGSVGTPLGGVREHGNAGAFVSLWTIDKATLEVLKVEDLLQNNTSIFLSNNNPSTGTVHTGYLAGDTTVISRLCSADLAPVSAYFWTDPATGQTYGTSARIFQTGEESVGTSITSLSGAGDLGPESTVFFGRQWNMILTDDPNTVGDDARTAYEMPHCGLFNWENNLANPLSQLKTIVAGMDDTSPAGQVYFWIGEKQQTGNVVERAGLVRTASGVGDLFVVKVAGLTPDGTGATNEDRNTPLNGTFSLEKEGDVSGLTGLGLENLSDSKGATQFLRPEDGAWDPNHPSDYYFVTTDRYDQVKDGVGTTVGRSRLYKLHFTDISNPTAGGTITCLLDGTEAGNMFDNIDVDTQGRVLLVEDVGGQAHSGKVWLYDIATDTLTQLGQHDPTRFGDVVGGVVTPATAPFNNDEEASGILDVSDILGPGSYLLDVQAHYGISGELVEGGQLLLMRIAQPKVESVVINDGSAQRSRVNSITVTFNTQVTFATGAFELTDAGGNAVAFNTSSSVVGGKTVVVFTFSGSGTVGGALTDGNYTLTVHGDHMADSLGQKVDADGDDNLGGDLDTAFGVLFGDIDGDGVVTGRDVSASAHSNGAKVGDADYFWFLDYNADGKINGKDHREVARRNGQG